VRGTLPEARPASGRVPAYPERVSSGLEQRIPVQLRWRDMDMLGHLNQSVYHELLEEGRGAVITELMRRAGNDHAHGAYVLAHVDLDYHAEVRKDHREVEIVVRVADVGTSSFRLHHEVRLPDGTVAASGDTVLVGWDPAARGKRALSEAERAAAGRPCLAVCVTTVHRWFTSWPHPECLKHYLSVRGGKARASNVDCGCDGRCARGRRRRPR
jgi:acyl-CoA thioester hydrolase